LGFYGGTFWLGLEPGWKLDASPRLAFGIPCIYGKVNWGYPKKEAWTAADWGRREGVMVRLEPAQFEALDAWSAEQKPEPSRPEAIRRLVELGLKAKK